MKKKKGFTLVELLATLTVLGLIIAISAVSYISIKDDSLKQDYNNLISYLETKASNYAKRTGITLVTIEDLIKEGETLPDDETDIYNPIDRTSLNCYTIKSEFINGEYISKFIDKEYRNKDGSCGGYELETDYSICQYTQSGCEKIDNNKWFADNITLAIKYNKTGEIINNPEYQYSWLSTSGQTGTEAMITTNVAKATKSVYRFEVTMDGALANGQGIVAIDKEAPVVSGVKSDSGWATEKNIEITVSDFNGSGVKGLYLAPDLRTCPQDKSLYKTTVTNNRAKAKIQAGTYGICVVDNVGNISKSPYISVVDNIDSNAVEPGDITLTASTSAYTRELTLTGKAIDRKSGLEYYAFTTKNNVPKASDWKKISGGPTNKQVTYTLKVTANDVYNFYVKDKLGNYEPHATIQITNIDREGPEYVSGGAISINDETFTITPAVFTDISTPVSVYYYAIKTKDDKTTPKDTQITSTNRTIKGDCGTDYNFWVKATDKLGNYTIRKIDTKATEVCCTIALADVQRCINKGYTMSLTANTTAYAQSVRLTGRATGTNLTEYQISNSASMPSGGWIKVSARNSITVTKDVTSNGKYYLWVKDNKGNVGKREYNVTNIDRNIDSVRVSKDSDDYVSVLTLTGTAADNKAHIVAYAFSTTNNPSNWKSTSETVSITQKITLSSQQRYRYYYFCVKDKAGNKECRSISIEKLGTLKSTTFSTEENRTTSTFNQSKEIDYIKKIVQIKVTHDGMITGTPYVSGGRVYYRVTGGKKLEKEELKDITTGSSHKKGTSVKNCSCDYGGILSGSECLPDGSSRTYKNGQRYVNTKVNGTKDVATCDCVGGITINCKSPTKHDIYCLWPYTDKKYDFVEDLDPRYQSCTGTGQVKKDEQYWGECFMVKYDAICTSDYVCGDNEYKDGSGWCNFCPNGTLSDDGSTCTYKGLAKYNCYQYDISLQYIEVNENLYY